MESPNWSSYDEPDKGDRARAMIAFYSEVYKLAGYSFPKSLSKFYVSRAKDGFDYRAQAMQAMDYNLTYGLAKEVDIEAIFPGPDFAPVRDALKGKYAKQAPQIPVIAPQVEKANSTAVPPPQSLSDSTKLETRFGVVSIVPNEPNAIMGRKLLIDGVQVMAGEPVKDDYMEFVKYVQLQNNFDAVVLRTNCAGSLCTDSGLYRVLSLSAAGYVASPPFGQRNDIVDIAVNPNTLDLRFSNKSVATYGSGKMNIPAELK